jgi:chromosome segregation ATPase
LSETYLKELVRLVNEELDSTNGILKDELDLIDLELKEVKKRLSKLYDALETQKLDLDDLAPRIKELRKRQEELSRARIKTEADLVLEQVQSVDLETVKSYAQDLYNLLSEPDIAERKAFLRSFVKKIVVTGNEAVILYHIPMPPDEKRKHSIGVLPTDTPGGAKMILPD